MAATRFRTKAACRIARISPERFNEAVAAGNYPCAPPTDRGAARVFNMSQLIALYIYGMLLDQGYPPSKAGIYACKVSEILTYQSDEREITLTFTSSGALDAFGASDYPDGPPRKIPSRAFAWVVSRLVFDIEHIRQIIQREIDEELSVSGEDD